MTAPGMSDQVLLERVYRLGKQPELLLVEVVTALIAALSVFGPPLPTLHAAVGTAGVRLWGAGMAVAAGVFFTVVARARIRPPRQVLLELVALVIQIVLWVTYIGLASAVHSSGYASSLAFGTLAGVMLVRVTEILQDILQPRWDLNPGLTVPEPGEPAGPDST